MELSEKLWWLTKAKAGSFTTLPIIGLNIHPLLMLLTMILCFLRSPNAQVMLVLVLGEHLTIVHDLIFLRTMVILIETDAYVFFFEAGRLLRMQKLLGR